MSFQHGGRGKARERSDQAGEGVPSPTVGRFVFEFRVSIFFCTLNVIIMGGLCEVAYTNSFSPPPPYSHFFKTPISGVWGGGIGPCARLPYSYASDGGVAARIC